MSTTEETTGATTPGSEKIVLRSSDNKEFEVKKSEAMLSVTLRNAIESGSFGGAIPVPNVTGKILAKALEYCTKHHQAASSSGGDGDDWETDFVKGIDHDTVFDLMMAANYLDIRGLILLANQVAVDMIGTAKTPEELRRAFKIKNDFTPEEEQEILRQNQWAFDD